MSRSQIYPDGDWRREVLRIHETVIKKWDPYSDEDTRFIALALAGEVGELCNLVKKDWRGDPGSRAKDIAMELADIRIYLELLSACFGVVLDQACHVKIEELYRRWPEAKQ